MGFGGLDGTGTDQLLRSVVIAPVLRHRGLGSSVVRRLVSQGVADGARRLWLLAMRANPFFAELGWAALERERAAAPVRDGRLYQKVRPAITVLMS